MSTKIFLGAAIVVFIGVLGFAVATRPSATSAPVSDNQITTTATTTAASSNGVITMATIASHNSQADCWSAINGNAYNLTSWIAKHPGGEGAILSLCGKDGSAAFNGKHGANPRVLSVLAGFLVGPISK